MPNKTEGDNQWKANGSTWWFSNHCRPGLLGVVRNSCPQNLTSAAEDKHTPGERAQNRPGALENLEGDRNC